MRRFAATGGVALSLCACGAASAQTSIDLSGYRAAGIYALDPLAGTGPGVSGLEASAVTYARDRGTLFYVGDEGTGVVEITRTGQTVSTMAFSGGANLGWPVTSTHRDAEALAYLGNGVLVVGDERPQSMYRFEYNAGGSTNLAVAPFVSIGAAAGNNGLEGFAWDSRDGSWVTVKQQSPQDVRAGTLSFAVGGGTASLSQLFDPALLAVSSLSDVATLAQVDALSGTSAADNLLVLSLGSRSLLEVTRSGAVLSRFDLSGLLPGNAFEGVTVDENGTIYLIAEQSGGVGDTSMLVALAPIPGPAGWLVMLAGLTLVAAQRRKGA